MRAILTPNAFLNHRKIAWFNDGIHEKEKLVQAKNGEVASVINSVTKTGAISIRLGRLYELISGQRPPMEEVSFGHSH
jgi:hypothetical protein